MHIFTDRKHIIIDTRSEEAFINHHIDGSVFVGFHGIEFKYWLELLLPDKNIDIEVISDVVSRQHILDTIHQLGYSHATIMTDDVESEALSTMPLLPNSDDTPVLDVRDYSESDAKAHVADILQVKSGDDNQQYIVHCNKGYRSLIVVSVLKLLGLCKFIHVDNGELGQQKLK